MSDRIQKARRWRDAGLRIADIAQKLDTDMRTVYKYLAASKDQLPAKDELKVGPPKALTDLEPEILLLLRDTPEGFRDFWNYVWPETPMPAHVFGWVQSCFDYQTMKWDLTVLINCPPGHAKTTCFVIRMSIWRLAQNRSFRRILVSATIEFAKQSAAEIAQEMAENERLLLAFGRFQSETNWQPGGGNIRVEGSGLKSGYNIRSRGMQTQIYGFRGDEVVVDDIVSPEDVLTEDRRERVSWKFHNEIESRPDPGGRIFVIGTRQHNDDLYGELAKIRDRQDKPIWKHINFKAITDPGSKAVLWDCEQQGKSHGPDFPRCCRNYDFLTQQRDKMGSRAFAQTYQQEPIPPGAALVNPDWIYGAGDEPDRGCLDRLRRWGPRPVPENMQRVISYDPSGGRGYAALVVADVRMDKETFGCDVLELWHGQGAGIKRCLDELDRMADAYKPWGLIVEMNLLKATKDLQLFDKWSKQHSVRVLEHGTNVNKSSPGYGIQSLSVDFEFGRVRLAYGDSESQKQSNVLIGEATEYIPGTDTGTTDDELHALWFIKNNLARIVRRGLYSVAQNATGGWHEALVYGKGFVAAR